MAGRRSARINREYSFHKNPGNIRGNRPSNNRGYEREHDREAVFTAGHLWAFIVIGVFFGIVILGVVTSTKASSNMGSKGYRVEGVAHGAVQLMDIATNTPTESRDPALVKKALKGKLRRGDVIK